jgi:hypothetical protein
MARTTKTIPTAIPAMAPVESFLELEWIAVELIDGIAMMRSLAPGSN